MKTMSREIKFRAWIKPTKKMNEGNFALGANGCIYFDDLDFLGPKMFELMQYTGLLDKNKKKIYEGDIGTDINDEKYEVRFADGCFEIIHDGNVIEPLSEVATDMEIIGNIYENPTLLNEGDGRV